MDFLRKMINAIIEIVLKVCKGVLTVFLVFYICGAFECSQDKSIIELINRLDDDYPEAIRSKAAKELKEIGEPAIADLFHALKNKNKHIRREIPWILVNINNPAVLEPIIYALHDTDEFVAQNAGNTFFSLYLREKEKTVELLIYLLENAEDSIKVRVLRAIGEIAGYLRMENQEEPPLDLEENSKLRMAIMPVTALLKEKNPTVKITALWTLRRIHDPAPSAYIIPLLKDNNVNVRLAAFETLGILGGKQSLEPLIPLLDDTDWRIRMETAVALGRIGDKQAVGPLIERLEDRDWRVRYRTITALGTLKDERAVVPLVEAFEREDSHILKRMVVLALGENGHGRAVGFLGSLLYHKAGDITGNAVYALGKIGKPAVETLLKTLKRTDKYADYFREYVVAALGNIKDSRAFQPLVEALKHRSSGVRGRAVIALGEYKTERAYDALITALGDKEGGVRIRAIEILSRARYCPAYNAVKRLSEVGRDRFVRDAAARAVKSMEGSDPEVVERFPDGKKKIQLWCKCSKDGKIVTRRSYFNEENKLIKTEDLIDQSETRFAYFPGVERERVDRGIAYERMEKIYGKSKWFYRSLLRDGIKMQSEYKNGRLHGKVMEWDRKGIIRKEELWENGKLIKKIK